MNTYKCCFCQYSLSNKKNLLKHLKLRHDEYMDFNLTADEMVASMETIAIPADISSEICEDVDIIPIFNVDLNEIMYDVTEYSEEVAIVAKTEKIGNLKMLNRPPIKITFPSNKIISPGLIIKIHENGKGVILL